jgi:hypothetical protein
LQAKEKEPSPQQKPPQTRKVRARRATLALLAGALLLPAAAQAAEAPQVGESWVTDVTASSAKLWAKINPGGANATYRFEYVSQSAFEVSGYATAAKAPLSGAAALGAGTTFQEVVQSIEGLSAATAYRYRVLATNKEGTTTAPEHVLATQESSLNFKLADNRGWELVSPIDKGGGAIAAPEALFGGGTDQAAQGGGAVTYGSATAFGKDPKGAPPVSQYLSTRSASSWVTEDVSAPLASAAYGDLPDGAPYRLFSDDLAQGLLFGGLACRGEIKGCPAPNPVLAGSGAPSGYMAYYLRDGATGSYTSLLTPADLAHSAVSPEAFEASFAAASPDLPHVVLSSCAALTANATEAPAGPGQCDPEEQNLYEWSSSGLSLVNLLPGDTEGTPGAAIAAFIGAVSQNGARIYWTGAGNLYLREGTASALVGEGTSFQAASADGSIAYFSKEGHLYRYDALAKAPTDLTPTGSLAGVLGSSADGSTVYYQDGSGIERWREGTIAQVAPGAAAAAPSDYSPARGTSRVSPDGSHLAFLSNKELSTYDNGGEMEAYLYGPPLGGGAPQLICASCNPTGERPQGAASIPGTPANGSTRAYKPRVLSADGSRLFFDSSDELVVGDSNTHSDVYQWEAKGVGDCVRSPGCVSLISSGRALGGASFIDASADGSDAYFITDESLVGADPGSIDLYDARIGGGFPEAPKPTPCIADACQSLPPTPEDPDPGSLVKSSGNPAPSFAGPKKKKHRKHHKGHKKGKGHKGHKRGRGG